MNIPTPHFFLYSQASRGETGDEWSFVLKAADGSATFEAADAEPDAYGERLELLAVVRGLEALEQPSRVTLVTPSRYVNSGIAYGLPEWGRNGWMWEHFGELVPVKNRDLWQRLDRALKIHEIRGTTFRIDQAHGSGAPAAFDPLVGMPAFITDAAAAVPPAARGGWFSLFAAWAAALFVRSVEHLRRTCEYYGNRWLPLASADS